MTEPIHNFDQQLTKGHDQLFRTLGIPAAYKNGAGTTKNIRVIFLSKDEETSDEVTRIIAPTPIIRARESDIDDRDRDTAEFTIKGTVYKPDNYVSDGRGLLKIYLRT